MSYLKKTGAVIAFAVAIVVSSAHDFYLLPDKFFLAKGDTLNVHLYVGDEFKTDEERAIEKRYTSSCTWITATKTRELLTGTRDSIKPFLKRKTEEEGLNLIAIQRNKIHAKITMTPEKFTSYLKEEKLEDILKLRETLPAKTEEREKYTRYLKSLIMVGKNPKGDQYKKRLGHALEIILLDNPYAAKKGAMITAQLFFKDAPLQNGSVEVICKDKSDQVTVLPIRTDKDGKLTFKMDKSGWWIVRITYMEPCKGCEDADWESFWASYTFGVN